MVENPPSIPNGDGPVGLPVTRAPVQGVAIAETASTKAVSISTLKPEASGPLQERVGGPNFLVVGKTEKSVLPANPHRPIRSACSFLVLNYQENERPSDQSTPSHRSAQSMHSNILEDSPGKRRMEEFMRRSAQYMISAVKPLS
jgi:hypothetical protein